MTIKTIIAAIALENGEQQVACRPIRLAADHGAKLVLAHAIESFPESDPNLSFPANEEAIANVLEAEAIASLKQMAEGATVQTEIEVECGKADQFIERLIRDHAADLLVIGPGKPQNLRERIFGSTADRVVRPGYVRSWSSSARPLAEPTNNLSQTNGYPSQCGQDHAPCRAEAALSEPLRLVQLVSFGPHRALGVLTRKLMNQTSHSLGILNVNWS